MNLNERNVARSETLVAVLGKFAGTLEKLGPRCWRIIMSGEREVSVVADEYWCHLESLLPWCGHDTPSGRRGVLALLASNAVLPCGICHAVAPRSRAMCLLADISLHDDAADAVRLASEWEERLSAFCRLLDGASRSLPDVEQGVGVELYTPLTVDDTFGAHARNLCDTSGWEYHERGGGELAITLDVPGAFCQASVHANGGRECRISAILETPAEVSAQSRRAMATLMLTATHAVRMARATALVVDDRREYRWEVAWPKLPSESEFHRGLSALSIACRMTQRELLALGDESIASTYLTLRGLSSQ